MAHILPRLTVQLKILGNRWKLRFVKNPELGTNKGDCAIAERVMRVKLGLEGPMTLETIIHEVLHASTWCLAEEHVQELAEDITKTILHPRIRPYWDQAAEPVCQA